MLISHLLHATDNGPNLGYVSVDYISMSHCLEFCEHSLMNQTFFHSIPKGDMKTGCAANQFVPDIETEDKSKQIPYKHLHLHFLHLMLTMTNQQKFSFNSTSQPYHERPLLWASKSTKGFGLE